MLGNLGYRKKYDGRIKEGKRGVRVCAERETNVKVAAKTDD